MPQRSGDRPHGRVVSLFTGAGGLDIGLENAGLRVVAATDFDEDCVNTLAANQAAGVRIGSSRRRYLDGTRILKADVAEVVRKDLVPDGVQIEVLVGGPPCQPFSSSGRMGSFDDPRGRLFEHFVRIAGELHPRFILFENVRGLVTAIGPDGEPGGALLTIKHSFESIGYATRFATLNAADFGSPQRRVRLFMLASRSAPLPPFPTPTHARTEPGLLLFGLKPWLTLGEFLSARARPAPEEWILPTPALAKALSAIPAGSGIRSAGIREATRPGGHWGYKQGTFIADRAKPARTVTTSTQDWIREDDGTLRRLTWREGAALQGFPASWRFEGNSASRMRQIGNAVPAVFGEVIGRALVSALSADECLPVASAPLPDDFHIAMDYTKRERRRNGASRRAAKESLRRGVASVHVLKGFGRLAVPDATE